MKYGHPNMGMSKADSFMSYQQLIELKKYTCLDLKKYSSHNNTVTIDTIIPHSYDRKGRHFNPPVQRENRTCPFWKNTTEDECHFILNCPLYDDNRVELTQEVKKTCFNYDQMNDIQKFIFIMSNENENIIKNLAKYIFYSMKKRNEFLNPETN